MHRPERTRVADPLTMALRAVLIVGSAAALYWGWSVFWFLTDDAFIAFRYVSNSMLGVGLVWNPPPFRPVEGYTSFAWVMLLKYVWMLTGVAPPESSNWVALGFGYATLFLGYRMMLRMTLPPAFEKHRWWLLALVILGTLTNRTFLAWLSSGLETAMFNFALTWWVYMGLTRPAERGRWWILGMSSSCVLAALTRPDGLLYLVAGAAILIHGAPSCTRRLGRRPLLGSLVLAAVPAHIAFRRMYYGEWLPNTYYAKVIDSWPETGIVYGLSFVLEYGVWVWGALAVVFLVRTVIVDRKNVNGRLLWTNSHAFIVVMTLVAHVAYYMLRVGGDHFEYRVLSHLVLLLFVSAVWLASRTTVKPALAYAWVAAFVLMSWPIPWMHWHLTHDLNTRRETIGLRMPIAPHVPALARPGAEAWDRMQDTLISRLVCVRHQSLKVFCLRQLENWPSREEGLQYTWKDHRAVLATGTVGVPGWVLPEVAVIDVLGLNDWVIARNPTLRPGPRRMAHSRIAPPGYVQCFDPNVVVVKTANIRMDEHWFGHMFVEPREQPLTDDRIRWCESQEWY